MPRWWCQHFIENITFDIWILSFRRRIYEDLESNSSVLFSHGLKFLCKHMDMS